MTVTPCQYFAGDKISLPRFPSPNTLLRVKLAIVWFLLCAELITAKWREQKTSQLFKHKQSCCKKNFKNENGNFVNIFHEILDTKRRKRRKTFGCYIKLLWKVFSMFYQKCCGIFCNFKSSSFLCFSWKSEKLVFSIKELSEKLSRRCWRGVERVEGGGSDIVLRWLTRICLAFFCWKTLKIIKKN